MNQGLTNRLRRRLAEKELSANAASVAAGLGRDAVRNILDGKSREPSAKTVAGLASVLGCSMDWLWCGGENQVGPLVSAGSLADGLVEIDRQEFAAVPRFDARLSAGPGSILPDHPEPEGYQLFERQWLRAVTAARPASLALLRIAGDSMEDTLSDGDWVMVDRDQRNPAHEGIFALHVDDVAWVKRLSVNHPARTIRIISDNPRWPPQEWPADQVRVLGRVVWLVGRKVA